MNLLLYYMNSTASILFVLLCMIPTAQAASFNCKKAVTKIEKLICNDDELSKLDESLKDAYLKALNRKESKKQIIESQRQWLKKERNICLDSECIKRAYAIRIKELGFSSSYGIVFFRESGVKNTKEKQAELYTSSIIKDSIIKFTDDFEYSDSPTNHGWKFIFDSTDSSLFSTNELAQSGSRCLKGFLEFPKDYKRIGLIFPFRNSAFDTPIGPDDIFEIVVHSYDDEVTGSDYKFRWAFNYIDFEGRHRAVSFGDTKEKYAFSPKGAESIQAEYFSARKKGWHEIKYLIQNNSINLYFDGILVIQNHSKVEKLVNVEWTSAMISPKQNRPLALCWIDNVTFTRTKK